MNIQHLRNELAAAAAELPPGASTFIEPNTWDQEIDEAEAAGWGPQARRYVAAAAALWAAETELLTQED